jgi:hypothetical protein
VGKNAAIKPKLQTASNGNGIKQKNGMTVIESC